ncbi:MAG TPA: pyridoxamine 5'-phosphate oxidase family protein [Desulfuromonadales bacterium]|jgi:putative heme iron utilization protein
MDTQTSQSLAQLIRTQRIAALATVSDAAPLVSMVQYATSTDLSSFFILISRLALHTQSIQQNRRVGLMIMEQDSGEKDPQTLARVSIRGEATEMPSTAPAYEKTKAAYLEKFPRSALNFRLEDFNLYCIKPYNARYVEGFGKIFDLTAEEFRRLA